MEDFLYGLLNLDRYTVIVAMCFVAVAFWLIHGIIGSMTMAVLSAPVLLMSALAANYLFRANYIFPVNDKDTNVVIASAVGVLVALVLLLTALWISVIMSERRSKNRRPLPGLPARE